MTDLQRGYFVGCIVGALTVSALHVFGVLDWAEAKGHQHRTYIVDRMGIR